MSKLFWNFTSLVYKKCAAWHPFWVVTASSISSVTDYMSAWFQASCWFPVLIVAFKSCLFSLLHIQCTFSLWKTFRGLKHKPLLFSPDWNKSLSKCLWKSLDYASGHVLHGSIFLRANIFSVNFLSECWNKLLHNILMVILIYSVSFAFVIFKEEMAYGTVYTKPALTGTLIMNKSLNLFCI